MMKCSLKQVLNYVSIITIFSGGYVYQKIFGILLPVELRIFYFIMLVILFLWFWAIRSVYFNKTFLILFFVVILSSLFAVFMKTDTLFLLFKQIIGIVLTSFFFYMLFKINNYDVKALFSIYLNMAFVVSLIGIIQEISFICNFRIGYDYDKWIPLWVLCAEPGDSFLRLNSILPEPAHFCNVMVPALFVSFLSFVQNHFWFQSRFKSCVIIIAFLLTRSLSGYIAALFAAALILYNYRTKRRIIMSGIMMIIIMFLSYNIREVNLRVSHSLALLTGKLSLREVNLSTFAIASNALVSYRSFKNNPLFGSGLGSHPVSYAKYIGTAEHIYKVQVNRKDAAALLLRIFSEMGLFGFFIFSIFIIRFYISKREDEIGYLWIISNALVTVFFIRLLRMGHYFNEGFFFFIWMYYFAKVKQKMNGVNDKVQELGI